MVIDKFTSSSTYMVRWYIFDIGVVLISLRINEFFSLRETGGTYLTMME
jgi:hypothetical protein